MNTIKIPVKVTTVEETFVEVQLPCYTRVESSYYYVKDEKNVVSAWSSGDGKCGLVETFNLGAIRAFEKGYSHIAKEEFDAAFERAVSIIKGEQP